MTVEKMSDYRCQAPWRAPGTQEALTVSTASSPLPSPLDNGVRGGITG